MKENSKTSNRLIHREADVKSKVLSGLDKISLPVIETISPMGKNVLIQREGGYELTNDGVTIARSIEVEDQIESAVIELIKDAATRTNSEAGDGTSTTILFSRTVIKKVLELQKKGLSQRDIRGIFNKVQGKILARLEKMKRDVKDDKALLEIATISANNDKDIAVGVVEVVKNAGLDGQVILEPNNGESTVIERQAGYRIQPGMQYQHLYDDVAKPQALYKEMLAIILDKTLYYGEECEHIMRVAKESGYGELLVIAKDFQGDSPNTFITNHANGRIKVVLAKLADDTLLGDIAVYLDGKIVSEASGKRVEDITIEDYVVVDSVMADPLKILIKSKEETKKLKERVKWIKSELEKDKENRALKSRLASLTSGIVTAKIGGRTPIEIREKIYRYEDAINAVRSAKKWGYLIGGGLSMLKAYNATDYSSREEKEVALAITSASLNQIAENSMVDIDFDKVSGEVGYNSATGKYENLLKAGVIEPYKATEMAVKNSISVADILTSIGTYIVYDYGTSEDDE